VLLVVLAPSATAATAGPTAAASVETLLQELVRRGAFFALGLGIIVAAWLVNRYAPLKRKRIRRVVFLFVIYVVAFALSLALESAGSPAWADRFHFVASLAAVYTTVNLLALALFDLALPSVGVTLVSLTSDIAVGVSYIVVTVLVLRAWGVNTGSVLATGAVVSGFIALSLQNTLSNIFGGIALQLDDSVRVGDWIQLENGRSGKVKEVRWRHTVVETRDWDTLIVPNATLLSSNIMILGKREGAPLQHRMWVYFHVDFRYSPAQVISAINEALQAAPIERVAEEPKPHCIVMDLARDTRESFAYYAVRYWLTDIAVDDPTSSAVRGRIFHALRRAGIPLARPASTVFMHFESEEAEERRAERHHDRRLAAVRDVDLFDGLTPEEIEYVAMQLRYAPFTAGETLTKQGAVAHWLYLLAQGTVEVRTTVEGVKKTVATLQGPSFFGEMGLMTGEPRTADVVATTEVECYRLDKATFEKVLRDRPEIAEQVSKILAARRVGLEATREGLDAAARLARQRAEQLRILGRIQDFFALK
jgi:small-conductance mechanosensitive channel/CRP-like cAMP-binding protein